MMWLMIGGVIVWGLVILMPEEAAPVEREKRLLDRPCILEHDGKYWNGSKFLKDRSAAKKFPNDVAAFDYADENFTEDVAEDCGVETVA